MNPTTVIRYTGVAIGLHWLMAVLIVAGFALGWTVADMEFSPQKLRWMSWHKWLGITVLGLVALWLLWRLTHSAPPLPTVPPLATRGGARVPSFVVRADVRHCAQRLAVQCRSRPDQFNG